MIQKARLLRNNLSDRLPFVSVIVPVRNEEEHLERCLKAIVSQEYPQGHIEVIVADGESTDRTRQVASQFCADWQNVKLIQNPGKIVSTALNLLIKEAKGDIIVRVDGHAEIESDYIRRCVETLSVYDADCVGGTIKTMAPSYVGKCIAAAMSSQFGVGNSMFRTVSASSPMQVDTVPFPAYTKMALMNTGAFDEELVRNQDDEYNYRLRSRGGKIVFDVEIRSRYYCRTSLLKLIKQYFQYGFWKVRVLQKLSRQMKFRQFVPPIFVSALFICLLGTMFYQRAIYLFCAIFGLYLIASLVASARLVSHYGLKISVFLPICFLGIHVAYGSGFLAGLGKFSTRWGDRSHLRKGIKERW